MNPTDWKWWCEACGSLTNDGECDCTKFAETVGCQRLLRTAGIDWTESDDENPRDGAGPTSKRSA